MSMLMIAGVAIVKFGMDRTPHVRPHLLLVVLDTVRADHVAIASDRNVLGRDTTPFLRSLAKDGVNYPEARSNANWTLPSHASIFTGLLPSEHGCHFEHRWLKDECVTLAEDLAERDQYATAAFSANVNVSNAFNVLQGFRDVYESARDPQVPAGASGSDAVLAHAAQWIATRPNRPCFVFVNLMDAHLPYDAAPGYERAFGDRGAALDRASLSAPLLFDRVITGQQSLDESFTSALAERYDDAIRGQDARLERFVTALPAEFREHLVIVVTSDHGEDLGDHGLVDHQGGLHESLLRVPLVLHGDGVPHGEVARTATPIADIFRIAQDLVNGNYRTPLSETGHAMIAERMQPVAVLERLAPKLASLAPGVADRLGRRERALVVAGEPWKLLRAESASGAMHDELFRLGPNPADEAPLEDGARQSDLATVLDRALSVRRRIAEAIAEERLATGSESADAAASATLAQIGYATAPARPSLGIHGAEHFAAGNRAFNAGDFAAAEGEYRIAGALAPDSADIRFNLALTLERAGKDGESAAWIEYLKIADAQHGQDATAIEHARQRLAASDAASAGKPGTKTSR